MLTKAAAYLVIALAIGALIGLVARKWGRDDEDETPMGIGA